LTCPYPRACERAQSDRKALEARKAAFLKRPFKLSLREQLDLVGVLKNTLELRGAYDAREAFMEVWRHRKRDAAAAALDEWRNSVPEHLRGLFRPVMIATRNREPEILNHFSHGRLTNAATEARNCVGFHTEIRIGDIQGQVDLAGVASSILATPTINS
jgi:transposase